MVKSGEGVEGPCTRNISPSTLVVEQRSVEQDVDRLHKKVAEAVMATLNTFWREAEKFMGEAKIGDSSEYTRLARDFSHRLRKEIKESYGLIHGSLQVLAFFLSLFIP